MRIAVISDTHELLRPEVIEIIKTSDAVIHGGDIDNEVTWNEIKTAAGRKPLFVVRGNNDGGLDLPDSLTFEFNGIRFFLVHNKKDIPKAVEADIIIFGHSHKYYEETINGQLWLNPGSCGKRRFNLPVTMAVLNIDNGKYSVKKAEFENYGQTKNKVTMKNIKDVMRYVDKGLSVGEISRKLSIDREFVDQVIRIIVTHPGVTAEGIMNKMEVNDIRKRHDYGID